MENRCLKWMIWGGKNTPPIFGETTPYVNLLLCCWYIDGSSLKNAAAAKHRSTSSLETNLSRKSRTVDGSEIGRSPVDMIYSSHYLQGFNHVRWCRISSINSITTPGWKKNGGETWEYGPPGRGNSIFQTIIFQVRFVHLWGCIHPDSFLETRLRNL